MSGNELELLRRIAEAVERIEERTRVVAQWTAAAGFVLALVAIGTIGGRLFR